MDPLDLVIDDDCSSNSSGSSRTISVFGDMDEEEEEEDTDTDEYQESYVWMESDREVCIYYP